MKFYDFNSYRDSCMKYKILLTMKLTIALIFCLVTQVSATAFSQNSITIAEKNVSLERILVKISEQSGFDIIYNTSKIRKAKNVSINVKDVSLSKALDLCFAGQPVDYVIESSTVVVKDKGISNLKIVPKQLIVEIRGKILDEKGLPVSGASITEKGTSNVVKSNNNGEFIINVKSDKSVLSVTYIGYVTREVEALNNVEIVLTETTSEMNEVVIVGFGKQKKVSVVGAISSISPKDLKIPTSTLSNAFAGRIAGVVAVQRGGEPGADGSNFWIRGISTFTGNTSPLIFIDGVESSIGDMNNLAPEVIDNFSVLKDASATALYGARGANGVMLITTKRGGDMDKARINVRLDNTISTPTKLVKMANAVDYMTAYNYAILNRLPTATPRFSDEKIQGTIDNLDPIAYPNVNWQDYLFKDFAMNQYGNINVTGGGKRADYFISGTFNNDNGMLKKDPLGRFDNNIAQQEYNIVANVGVNLTDNTKAVVRINSQLADYSGSSSSTATIYNSIFFSPPALFAPVLPSPAQDYILFGNLNGGPIPVGSGGNIYQNPYAVMVSGYTKRFTVTNTASFELNQNMKFLLPGLNLKGLVSYKNNSANAITRSFVPFYSEVKSFTEDQGKYNYTYNAITRGTTALSTSSSSSGERLMTINLVADWARSFADHDVSGMVAFLSRDNTINAAGTAIFPLLPYRNQGIAGRVTYGYKSRYFIEGNFGYNGSDNFENGMRFGFFPSVAAGYLISNETFWKPLAKVVNSLKIRGSYGLVGNDQISGARFPYLDDVNLSTGSYVFGSDWQTSGTGASITRFGAKGATWEEGEKYNVGVDLGLFEKLNLTVDFFSETRDKIFMQRRVIAAETGIVGTNPFANVGKVKNSGFDGNLSYQQQFTPDFYVNLRGTFTFTKNTLLDRDEPKLPYAYLSELGKPLNRPFGLIADGFYKDDADIVNSPVSTYNNDLKPGDLKYKDLNGDNKIDDNDRMQFGNPTVPQIIYGFGVSSQYKKFDFSFFFQGAAKTSLVISGIHPFNSDQSGLLDFIAKDYWTPENPNASYPRLISSINNHNNFQPSTFWLRDGAFIRLKNVEIGYTYKFARMYLSGQNLLTFSDFKLWDPELGGGRGLSYPNLKIGSIGVQFQF
ncbi:TonB-dependent receptor [Pedobacter frigoris]|uniref:TonB-dependent receptor n=1 Tax=Pedobacter frigoris TaxID=2571272 RepID=UPI002930DE16|nr:TonB-dependent receptor [Pedobacter frigoris]